MSRLDEQMNCALCGMLLPQGQTIKILSSILTIGRVNPEKVRVCSDSSACRRRAIEIIRAYEKMKP